MIFELPKKYFFLYTGLNFLAKFVFKMHISEQIYFIVYLRLNVYSQLSVIKRSFLLNLVTSILVRMAH